MQGKSTYRGYDDSALGRIVAQRPWLDVLATQFAHADDARIATRSNIMGPNIFVADVEQRVSVQVESRSFSIELEDDQTRVVTFDTRRIS
jgi:hypothetical protein